MLKNWNVYRINYIEVNTPACKHRHEASRYLENSLYSIISVSRYYAKNYLQRVQLQLRK